MSMIEALLPEFDREMTTTRKVLERVPNESLAWKPHAKSFSLGELASHVAALPTFAAETLNKSEFEIGNLRPPVALPSRTDVLAAFDAIDRSCTCCPWLARATPSSWQSGR